MTPPDCPRCGHTCERIRINDSTTHNTCPTCETDDRLHLLFALALLEGLQYLLVFAASAPLRIARGLHRLVTTT